MFQHVPFKRTAFCKSDHPPKVHGRIHQSATFRYIYTLKHNFFMWGKYTPYPWILNGGSFSGSIPRIWRLQISNLGLSPLPGCWLVTTRMTGDPNLNRLICHRMPVANEGLGWDPLLKNVIILMVTGILGGGTT